MFGPSSDVSSLREKKKIKKKERERGQVFYSFVKNTREKKVQEKKKSKCVTVQ